MMDSLKKIKNFGIGADIESIERFRKLDIVNNSSFFNRIFTKSELDYCLSKKDIYPHLAVRFAGKEAVVKALSSLGKTKLNYKDIEIFNSDHGVPIVKINNHTDFYNLHVSLSLSHCKDKALGFAVIIDGFNHEEN